MDNLKVCYTTLYAIDKLAVFPLKVTLSYIKFPFHYAHLRIGNTCYIIIIAFMNTFSDLDNVKVCYITLYAIDKLAVFKVALSYVRFRFHYAHLQIGMEVEI